MRHRSVIKVISKSVLCAIWSVLYAKWSVLYRKGSILYAIIIISNWTLAIQTQVMEDDINVTLYLLRSRL